MIPYGDIPRWPASGVVGHAGTLVAGTLGRRRVAASCQAGLTSMRATIPSAATFGVRVLGALGVRVLVLTNAAGGINTSFGGRRLDGD